MSMRGVFATQLVNACVSGCVFLCRYPLGASEAIVECTSRIMIPRIAQVWRKNPDAPPCCIFQDVQDVSKQSAKCVMHGGMCSVVKTWHVEQLTIAGWSCKDLSTMRGKVEGAALSNKNKGTSSKTLHGVIEFLEAAQQKVYIGENVEEVTNLVWALGRAFQIFSRSD